MSRGPTPMIHPTYVDAFGEKHVVPEETLAALREAIGEPGGDEPLVVHPGERIAVGKGELTLEDGRRLEVTDRLQGDLPLGYHRLTTDEGERRLIVSPGECYLPAGLRRWGWSTQLYAARSRRSWGMGDFADLETIARWSGRQGAGMLLVNPVLAASPTVPQEPSPYYPTSRRFLNPIYLRIEEVPGAEALGDRLETCAVAGRELNRRPLIDRDAVWGIKLEALEEIWSASTPAPDFESWRRNRGEELVEFAVWCVLTEIHRSDWREWPSRYRHPQAPAVGQLAEARAERVRFHQWLQWLCRRQLDRVVSQTMLVQDLPIGFDPGGADAWAWQDLLALDMAIGAPPDEFNTRGQNWAIPPFVPHRLAAVDYEPFIQTLRAGLTPGGGLRIDHVVGLFRQFWVPSGASPAEGTYVGFPSDDLLDILALESHRAGAVMVGEDLGTVPPGTREELARRKLLSYRLLWFEDDDPRSWPELSLASISTHDLPTVAGLWTGADLQEQKALDMSPNESSTRRIRRHIAEMAGLSDNAPVDRVVTALHRKLGEAPSRLVCATLDDAARTRRRPNIPGADHVQRNWSLPLPVDVEDLTKDPIVAEVAAGLDASVGCDGDER